MKRIALAIIMLTACGVVQAKNHKTVEHEKAKITVKEKDDKGKTKAVRTFALMFANNRKAPKK